VFIGPGDRARIRSLVDVDQVFQNPVAQSYVVERVPEYVELDEPVLFFLTAPVSIWVARVVFDFDHHLACVDPLHIVFEDSRFGVGQADDSVGTSSASGPFLTAGVLEELGFCANEVLVDGESDLIRVDERSDEVVILVPTVALSVWVRNPHFGQTYDMRFFLRAS